jgi:L-cysteine/cystine lyase
MLADRPEERTILTEIREALPAVQQSVYLNCGTAGPLSRRAIAAMQAEIDDELTVGRIRPSFEEKFLSTHDELRRTLARRIGCAPDEISLSARTTDGMNIALWGLSWQPGDEVLTTRHEHRGLTVPLAALAAARGVSVRYVEWPEDRPDLIVEAFERAIHPRTRLIALSHVLWTNGTVMPVREIADRAHAEGALMLVDGAQAAGAVALDLSALGADFYSLPGQKWLLGPEGTGALYAARQAQALCRPTFTGYLSSADVDQYAANYLPAPGARRYEIGPLAPALAIGQLENLRWQAEAVEEQWALARISTLARELRQDLINLPGVQVTTPKAAEASGIVSFRVDGMGAPEAAKRLQDQGFLVRFLPQPFDSVRVSTGFYLLREELARLVDAIRALAHLS